MNIKGSIQWEKSWNDSSKRFLIKRGLAQPLYLGGCLISLPRTVISHLNCILESPGNPVPINVPGPTSKQLNWFRIFGMDYSSSISIFKQFSRYFQYTARVGGTSHKYVLGVDWRQQIFLIFPHHLTFWWWFPLAARGTRAEMTRSFS